MVLADIDGDAAQAAAERIAATGARAIGTATDVADEDSVRAMMRGGGRRVRRGRPREQRGAPPRQVQLDDSTCRSPTGAASST
ncbi:MAG: hypothetical protein U0W40_13285 [Acidimicrobiia bacterium]